MFNVLNFVRSTAVNSRGWQTSRKIVVFESDDWGSIGMPSREVLDALINRGLALDKSCYNSYDSLASETDLNELFNVLGSHKDSKGRHPVFTANCAVTNPDFDKIRESGFTEYHYELFTETLKKYPEHARSFNLWKKGMEDGLFYPQFHCREHLNVKKWLSELRNEGSLYRTAFKFGFWALNPPVVSLNGVNVLASLDMDTEEDLKLHEDILTDGLNIFANIFGYSSKSFIANNYIYHSSLHRILARNGIRYIQGMKYRKHPVLNNGKREMIRRVLGEVNEYGQYDLVRNAGFEPSQKKPGYDSNGECLAAIRNAFLLRKPAIISTHRLNYTGYINRQNRERNLKKLQDLLKSSLKNWPDIEFMTSCELGDEISGNCSADSD